MLILVFKDALESLKLESKPPFPEHPVGRQPACLWDGRVIQASHSLDQFSQDRKANQLLEILCLTGKWSWWQPLRTGAPFLQRQGPGAPWLPCDAPGAPWAPRRRVYPPPKPPERCTQTPLTSSPRPGPPLSESRGCARYSNCPVSKPTELLSKKSRVSHIRWEIYLKCKRFLIF